MGRLDSKVYSEVTDLLIHDLVRPEVIDYARKHGLQKLPVEKEAEVQPFIDLEEWEKWLFLITNAIEHFLKGRSETGADELSIKEMTMLTNAARVLRELFWHLAALNHPEIQKIDHWGVRDGYKVVKLPVDMGNIPEEIKEKMKSIGFLGGM